MPLASAAVLRHLLRHPAQLLLALAGLALGVATIAAVDMATASAARAFELSIDAVNGAATHEIVAGPAGIDERWYVALRRAQLPIDFAPVVDGYAEIGDRTMQLVGIDPFASPAFDGGAVAPGAGAGATGLADFARWLTKSGAVMMAGATAAELHLHAGDSFLLEVSGHTQSAEFLAPLGLARPGDEALLLTDIAQAQEWLHTTGNLSRIDLRVPSGRQGELALARLQSELPTGAEVHAVGSRTRENLDLAA